MHALSGDMEIDAHQFMHMHVMPSYSFLVVSQHSIAPAISGAAVPGEGGEAYTGWARYVGRTVACFNSSLLHSMTSSPCSSTVHPQAECRVQSHSLNDQLSPQQHQLCKAECHMQSNALDHKLTLQQHWEQSGMIQCAGGATHVVEANAQVCTKTSLHTSRSQAGAHSKQRHSCMRVPCPHRTAAMKCTDEGTTQSQCRSPAHILPLGTHLRAWINLALSLPLDWCRCLQRRPCSA